MRAWGDRAALFIRTHWRLTVLYRGILLGVVVLFVQRETLFSGRPALELRTFAAALFVGLLFSPIVYFSEVKFMEWWGRINGKSK